MLSEVRDVVTGNGPKLEMMVEGTCENEEPKEANSERSRLLFQVEEEDEETCEEEPRD